MMFYFQDINDLLRSRRKVRKTMYLQNNIKEFNDLIKIKKWAWDLKVVIMKCFLIFTIAYVDTSLKRYRNFHWKLAKSINKMRLTKFKFDLHAIWTLFKFKLIIADSYKYIFIRADALIKSKNRNMKNISKSSLHLFFI